MKNIPNFRDFEVVSDALRSIPFPLPLYHDWVRIGFALYASFGMDGMRLLYDVSCAPFPEYRNETPEKLAAKFRNANGSVSLGTIFHFARQHGWKYKQPTKIQNEVWHLVAWHDYRDAQGNRAYRINRHVSPDGAKKRMTIERYENGEKKFDLPPESRLPYNLPQVREAIQKGETIYFVEGESDADALAANGYTATCVPFGACGWNKRYAEHFKGASICFIPDNDKTGKALPLNAIPDLLSVAKEVKVIELSDAKDVRELINTKGTQAFLSLTPIDATQYLAKHKLPENYPLTRINASVPESDLDDFEEIPTLESYANIDYTFDESLVPNGIFREVYDHITREADVPAQFIFTGVLAMFCGIVGTRISSKFGTQKFKPHDYFTLIANSGGGKTTTLESVRDILSELEKEVTDKDKPYQNVFLYPKSSTLRGLLDLMREESEAELHARTVAKEKGKPEPPPKVAQRSGVAIINEVSALFDATKSDFNTGLDATLLELWDGNPGMNATGIRTDGKMLFEDTALTLLSASTPRKFVDRLPKGSFLDGMLPRFQIVNARRRTRPRKRLTSFKRMQANHNEIVEKLKQFYQFVVGLSEKPVLVSEEAEALDEQSLQVWHEESMNLKDETAENYMERIDTRKIRYALLFSILECYDQHGRFADAITMTGTAMQRAIEVCEFYKTHTLHFLVKAKAIKPKAPNEKEPLPVQLKNKLIELGGTVDMRELYRAMNLDKQTFMKALNQLLDTRQVVLTQRKNIKGRNVDVVSIPKKMQNGYDSMTVMTVCEINTTETQTKPKNASHCHKPHCHNAYDSVATQPTVPEPTVSEPINPEPNQPLPAPEPEPETTIAAKPVVNPEKTEAKPMPAPEASSESLLLANACEIARSLHVEFTENEFQREAMLFHGATPQTAKAMLRLLIKNGYLLQHDYLFIRTSKLYTSDAQAKPMPAPESEPEPPKAKPMPVVNPETTTTHDLARLVLSYLENFWTCKKIPGDELRRIIATSCGKQSDAVWELLFPAHVVKLHTTDCFILREHERRPKGYDGLIDDAGILPSDEPAPF